MLTLVPGPVACLAIPQLELQGELYDRPWLLDTAVALTDEARNRVASTTPRARVYGVRAGMTLREADALCPLLTILEPRPAVVAEYAQRLVEAMSAVSPLVEEQEPGIVFADVRGMEALYPRAEDLYAAVSGEMPGSVRPQLGLATTRLTALVAAYRAEPGAVEHVAAEHAAAFLSGEAITFLPFDVDAINRLRLMGIETCGALAALPRHAVQAQFGPMGEVAWLAAQGMDPRPVRPRPWERERVVEHVQAEPPLISRETVQHAVEQLLGRALRQPRAHHRFVRFVRLHAETERGELWEREQVLREPLGDRERLWTVLRALIEYAEFPGPFAAISLELGGLTEESGRQHSLFTEQTRRREHLDEMVRHLKVRFGESPVARVVEVEPWHRLPEHRRALLEYDP